MTSGNANRHFVSSPLSRVAFDETALLARIGSNLRDLYGDVETATLPGDLLRLAQLIDGKRECESEDDRTT